MTLYARLATATAALLLPLPAFAQAKTSTQTGSINDLIAWLAAHPGVSVALVIGLSALIAGFVLNRTPQTR